MARKRNGQYDSRSISRQADDFTSFRLYTRIRLDRLEHVNHQKRIVIHVILDGS